MKKLYWLFLAALCSPFFSSAQWQSYDPGFPDTIGMSFVDVVNDEVVWAIGLRYGVDECLFSPFASDKCYYTRSADGGITWQTGEIPLGTVPFLANIAAIDANTAWMCGLDAGGGGSKVLKTNDGGTTWVHQTTAAFDPAASWVNFVHFRSPAAGITMGDPRDGYFEIYTTANGGDFWFRVPEANIDPPLAGEFGYNGAFDFVGNNYWFATNQGRVFHSSNGGNTWKAHQTTLTDGFFISFSDENHGLLAQTTLIDCSTNPPNFQFNMSRTSDGGATWEDATPATNNFAITGLKYIKGTSAVVMTGRESNLSGSFFTWVSQDHGTTWTQIGTGQNIGWMDFVDGNTGWGGEYQMLDNKTEMFSYIGGPLSGLFSQKALDVKITVFPNPTTDIVRINVDAGQVGDFLFLVNDEQGRIVRNEVVNNVASFQHHLDLSGLAAGMYSLTISSEKGSSATKFLKQ
jgi:photosystem II stability/assembly factor-like uncharacterized protein